MTRRSRLLVGTAVAATLAAGVGAFSRLPLSGPHADDSALRLSWRLRSEEAGECRRPTAEELQALPAHMRNPDACVGSIAPYRLRVRVDGEIRIDERVEASGVRGDRPLYVDRELILSPGRHVLQVRFAPEAAAGGRQDGAAMLHLETSVGLSRGDVRLVTRHPDTGALAVVRPRG